MSRANRTLEDRARFGLGTDTQDDNTDPATDEIDLGAEGVIEGTSIDPGASDILDHTGDTTDAHAASAISADQTNFDTAGSATDVQGVLEELEARLAAVEAAVA